MKVARENLVALLVDLGYKTAGKWNKEKTLTKMAEAIEMAKTGDIAAEDPDCDELLKKLVDADGQIEIVAGPVDEDETEDDEPEDEDEGEEDEEEDDEPEDEDDETAAEVNASINEAVDGKKKAKKEPKEPKEPKAKKEPKEPKAKKEPKVKKERAMGLVSACVEVLRKAKKPLKTKEIMEKIISSGLWEPKSGKTPEATLVAGILTEIKKKGEASRFEKVDRATYQLRG